MMRTRSWTVAVAFAGILFAAHPLRPASPNAPGDVPRPSALPQYADTAAHQDVIIDAPWYIDPGRQTVPVLLFLPEIYWKGSREYAAKLKEFILAHPRTAEWGLAGSMWFNRQRVLYRDTDDDTGVTKQFISRVKDEDGNDLSADQIKEGVIPAIPIQTPGWHRILQVPLSLLKPSGNFVYLAAYAKEQRVKMKSGQVVTIEETVDWMKMMRVQIGKEGFPSFDRNGHHQFDPHFHTMSEYTLATGALAPKQAFSGPWQMAVDCAFAMGMSDNDNRFNIANEIVSTDHCWEYSDSDFPEAGPFRALAQSGMDRQSEGVAGQAEYDLMRSYFGDETGGQEAHMTRWDHVDGLRIIVAAAHTLVYRHPRRIKAPWHGMESNGQTIETVMSALKDLGGFTFGAHPYNGGMRETGAMSWPLQYFEQGIQLSPYNERSRTRDGQFLVKGFQIWNERTAHTNAEPFNATRFTRMNPFAATVTLDGAGRSGSIRSYPPWKANLKWHEEFSAGQIGIRRFLMEGLSYAFQEEPDRRFLRKLYSLSATDAHGDFNYGTGHTSTLLDGLGVQGMIGERVLTSNAFGRVRTYVFGKTIDAMRKGQSAMTDGPVAELTLDTDLRFENPPPGQTGEHFWHDKWERTKRVPAQRAAPAGKGPIPRWEIERVDAAPIPLEDRHFTADGRMGGDGTFDGERTLLTCLGSPYTVLRWRWTNTVDFGGAVNRVELYKNRWHGDVRTRREQAADVEIVERDATLSAYGDGEWSYRRVADVKPDERIPGVRVPATAIPVMRNAAFSLAAFTSPAESGRYHPDEFRCFTNPVWASPVEIMPWVLNEPQDPYDRYAGDGGGGDDGDFEPVKVSVDFIFELSMRSDYAPRVRVRQLDRDGESRGAVQSLGPGVWLDRPARDDNYIRARAGSYRNAAGALQTQAGTAWWYDVSSRKSVPGVVSFVVYMEDPIDFHGNVLNAVAKTFRATLRSKDGQQKSTAYSTEVELAPGQKKLVRIPTYCIDPHTPCFTLRQGGLDGVGSKRDAVPILLIPPGAGDRGPLLKAALREAAAGKPVDVATALEAGLVTADARPIGRWLVEPAVLTNLAPHPLRVVIPVGTVLTPTKTPRRPEFLLEARGKREAIEVALAAQDLARRGQLELPPRGALKKAVPRERFREIVTQWATWYVVHRETPEAMREALEQAFPEEFGRLKEEAGGLTEAARELWAAVERLLAHVETLRKAAAAGAFRWTSIDPHAAVTLGTGREAVETR